ncbi:hypothetical protein IGI04_028938, partial [Brassica rapa subsp. trilocularis]
TDILSSRPSNLDSLSKSSLLSRVRICLLLWDFAADREREREREQSILEGIVKKLKMGGSDENRHGVIGPMNPQGGLRGGKANPGNGQTRRALSNINKNIIGAPVYPCAVNKRPLSEKNVMCHKKLPPPVPVHRPITRKFAAQLAENNPQTKKEETKSEPVDIIIIDVEEEEDGDFNEPMFVQHTEAMLDEIDRMEGIEMEDSNDTDEEEEAVMDIDSCDKKNPLAVVDYIDDIYDFYKKNECRSCVPPNYMENQPDINERMRGILVDWLIEVHYKFELMEETLYLTINLIDRFLAVHHHVARKKLQLVGVTAMLLACKYEEVSVPVVDDLILISDKAYTRREVLDMEKLMANTLQFNFCLPTPYVFMRRFLKAAQSDQKVELLSFFIVELCLVEYEMLQYAPSQLAASAIYTAHSTLKGFEEWSRTCEFYTGYTEEKLMECSRKMAGLHHEAGTGKLTGVYRKYNTSKFGYASRTEPAVTLLLLSSTENSFVTPLPAEETYQAKRKGGARRMMIYMPPSFSGRASGRGRVILVCKYEEISFPVVNDLILVSDKVYTGREVLDMEKLMAKYFAIQFLSDNSICVHEERVELSEESKTGWSEKETLLLLEAVMHYGDDWKKVAQHRELRVIIASSTMDGHASVRSTYEGFESEAAMKETLEKYRCKPRAIISVEGYDTCLPEEDIKSELTNHFNSCGEVFNVIVRKDPHSPNLDRRALVILLGDGAEEKALELNGTDFGGWNALVKVEPEEVEDEEAELYESSLADELYNDRRFWFGVTVRGYNTFLPADEVESALIKHFSSCGEITHVFVCTLDKKTNIYFYQQEGEARALDLDGSVVKGFKIAVTGVATIFSNRLPPSGEICFGYCDPAHMIEFSGVIQDKVAAFKKQRMLSFCQFFIIELCLVEYEMLQYAPSQLATSAIYTAQSTLKEFEEWSKTCEFYTGYSDEKLMFWFQYSECSEEDGWFASRGRDREANRSIQEIQHFQV